MAMRKHAWEDLLTPRDRKVMDGGMFGNRLGLGVRPCLLLIDMQYVACGDKDEDILEMRKRWPAGCGHEAWDGIRNQAKLLAGARLAGIPIIYTRSISPPTQFNAFAKKISLPTRSEPGDRQWRIVEEIAPQPGDIVLDKNFASALFGTPLISFLTAMRVDTVLLVGNSTGGCVRASAVDLATHNFNVAVIEDCVFDRIQLSHAAALLDLWMKYCDVIWLDEALGYLETAHNGVAVHPAGVSRA